MTATLPVRYNAVAAMRYGRGHIDPPGANRWESATSGHPVVLVHGLGIDVATSWYTLSPLLANSGFAVFALDYGRYGHGVVTARQHGKRGAPGVGDLLECAHELTEFIDRVIAATGAKTVSLVGHSVGALVAQYYIKRCGGDVKVDRLVGLAPTMHGSTINGLLRAPRLQRWAVRLVGENMSQQSAGSAFIDELYTDGDTVPGIEYTVISPRWDAFTTPVSSQRSTGPSVTNVRLRGFTEHVTLLYDRAALEHVSAALEPR